MLDPLPRGRGAHRKTSVRCSSSAVTRRVQDIMNNVPQDQRRQQRERVETAARLPARLVIELLIGLALAAVIMLVAWTSSSAIHFVYGGY